jgi:paraquat-inducible protein A
MHCHICEKLVDSESLENKHKVVCPRCGAALHLRLPKSISRTWAFLIASIIMYIPANVLPIMTVQNMGKGDPHTIIGGIIELIHSDMLPIAFLVFVASLMVPLLKMVGITFLLISVQHSWQVTPHYRIKLYRIIELIGRWSMLDIFMISILVAMVNLGAIAKVYANAGATAFAAVVILTMFASLSFDSRLIWDKVR